ncbi:MAG TPA: hypothetical protein ENI80_03480 [Acidiferrobacteraceae bacterium]|nr:hypothetical protein [Acidiferrobacteraceae bacterium]
MKEQTALTILDNLRFLAIDSEPQYSGEYIDEWAEIYLANNLRARGILFDTFLAFPQAIMDAVVFKRPMPLGDVDHYPLLPKQREVQRCLDCVSTAQEVMDHQLDVDAHRPGRNIAQVPALHGDRIIQSMRPRECPAMYKTRGGHDA